MYKKLFPYEDFDGHPQQEVLYFNISKTELAENLHLEARFQSLQDKIKNPGTMGLAEVQEMLDLVKTIMKLAYGVRSEDGKHFRKSEELWNDFKDSAVYDKFLFSLFENPEEANDFLLGVLPQDLRREAEKEIETKKPAPVASGDTNLSEEDQKLLEANIRDLSEEQIKRVIQLRLNS